MSTPTLAPQLVDGHQVLPETARPSIAKAKLRIPEMGRKEAIGRAIQKAVAVVGWTNKEAAAKVGVDDSQFGKWLSGAERPQFDRLAEVDELCEPLYLYLAPIFRVDVYTEHRVARRSA
jgi:hypothetical protein